MIYGSGSLFPAQNFMQGWRNNVLVEEAKIELAKLVKLTTNDRHIVDIDYVLRNPKHKYKAKWLNTGIVEFVNASDLLEEINEIMEL